MEYVAIQNRNAMRENGSGVFVADQPVAIAVQYLGSLASATVTVVSATGITFEHGTAGAEAVDSTVGASGVVAFATYGTLGAVVDAINLSPNWHAEIVDGLRADVTTGSTMLARAETTLSPTRGSVLSLFWDTSAHLSLSFAISRRRTNFAKSQKGYQAVFQQARALVNVGSGTLIMNIYEVPRDRSSATSRGTFNGTDNTELSALIAGGAGEIRSAPGNDLLVRYTMSVDLPDTGAYLNVAGYVE
jgi:hypothetical protein